MIIKHLETKNQEIRNMTTNGLSVKAFLNGEAASTKVDWSKCTIKLLLNRGNDNIVIMQDPLNLLGLASCVDLITQSAFTDGENYSTKLAAGQFMVSFFIPFGGHINLRDSDNLYLEVKNSDGLFTDADLLTSSFLEIKPIPSVGIETFIPRITTKVVQANETTNQYMIGDNVIRSVFLNLDKTTFENNVIENLTFTSNKLNCMFTYADLVQRKLERFGKQLLPAEAELATHIQQDQSFVLTDFHEEFDNLLFDVQFKGANVASSKNYIVVWTYETNWTIIDKANETAAKHNQEAKEKIDKASSGK